MLQRQYAFTLCICTNLAALFCVSAHTHEFSSTRVQTLPAYAVASVTDLINSTICGKELQNFRNAVDQRIPWSLKMLDSSGRFKPGFLYGNTYWLGSRVQCLDTMYAASPLISERKISSSPLHRDRQKELPPFEVNYFVAHFRHNSTLKYYVTLHNEDVITLGLCLPASCAVNDLIPILKRIFHDKVILIDDLYSVDFQLIRVKDLKDDYEWLSSGALPFVCIALAFSLFMITIGTIYDIFVYQKYVNENMKNKTSNNVEHVSKNIEMEIYFSFQRESRIGRILMCFSVYTNTKILFNTELDADAIPAFHGLKFLGMCCIIISHVGTFTLDSSENKIWLWDQMSHPINDYIDMGILINIGAVSIDIYFFASGCFMTLSYLKNKMNIEQVKPTDYRNKLIDLFVQIVKRFIRMTPAYMMTLGIVQLSSVWFDKTSQFYMHEKSHETCAKYWWRNLLYINNLFGLESMCMNWSWYIANDMQFYVIGMTLLTLSTTYLHAFMILGALLISSAILSGYTSYVYGIVPYVTYDRYISEFVDVFYFPPWIRINPYLIGMITGYILIKAKNYLTLKRNFIVLYLCLAIACNIFVLFALHMHHTSILSVAIYIAVYRVLYGITVALITIALTMKYGGFVNEFLSLKCWIPFSRLTYCTYLLHPVIMRTICLYSEASIHIEYLPMFVMGMGYVVISYFCSYVLTLMMMIPNVLLLGVFIQYRNTNKCKVFHRKVL